MEVVDKIGLAASQAVEIKTEDIESEPEPCLVEMKNENTIEIQNEDLIKFYNEADNTADNEDNQGSNDKDTEFRYISNSVRTEKSVEISKSQERLLININDHSSDQELTVKNTEHPSNQRVSTTTWQVPVGKEPVQQVPAKQCISISTTTWQVPVGQESVQQKPVQQVPALPYIRLNTTVLMEMMQHPEQVKQLKCDHCDFTTVHRHILSNHKFYEHGAGARKRKVKQCPHCPVKTTRLASHIYTRHTKPEDVKWHECYHCNYKAKWKLVLEKHIIHQHTDPDLQECQICHKILKSQEMLQKHTKEVHGPMKRLKCDYCEFTTVRKTTLKDHTSRHVNLEFNCTKCPDFRGKTSNELIKHQKDHHLEWKQCHLCPYKCKGNIPLRNHLIHHQEKKRDEDLIFKCQKCDYKTYRKYNLTIHMLNHKKPEELEMFYCYHCNFKAKRKDNLKTHIFKHGMYKKILDCYICSFKTSSQFELKKHIDTHSEDQKKEAKRVIISINNGHRDKINEKKESSVKGVKKSEENGRKQRQKEKNKKSKKKFEDSEKTESNQELLMDQKTVNNKNQENLLGDQKLKNQTENVGIKKKHHKILDTDQTLAENTEQINKKVIKNQDNLTESHRKMYKEDKFGKKRKRNAR